MGLIETDLAHIIWKPNPLLTQVMLTDVGRMRLQLGVAVDQLTDIGACLALAREENDYPKWCESIIIADDNDTELGVITRRASELERSLLGAHNGDCTCAPMSCVKCYTEYLIGINTIPDLGKHEAHAIGYQNFSTVADVIVHLERPIAPSWGTTHDWEPHLERWTQERRNAIEWMFAYYERHQLP